jgi:ergothioneine biosynthesis protein EgtB
MTTMKSTIKTSSSESAHRVNAATLVERFREVRAATEAIAEKLSPEDCQVQSMPDASPIKWHLAHTTWFFETFILSRFIRGYVPFHEAYKTLFNSYYNGVGDKHPRPERGLISRPTLAEVMTYRHAIDQRLCHWLHALDSDVQSDAYELLLLGFNHEQQHQELMLTDIKHMLSCNPLTPIYSHDAVHPTSESAQTDTIEWLASDGGIVHIGHANDEAFAFDNESPRHRALLQPYSIANRLVSNREFLEFVNDGAYQDHSLWLSDGWDWVQRSNISMPFYWRGETNGELHEFTLRGLQRLDLDAPVCHVSFYEADAYARWAGVRLPTEFEWEHAHTAALGMRQATDTVWQWTASAYLAYPGFSPARGAVGEYNGKFMNGQYVLRGGSCATPRDHARSTYRNFFQPDKRWQFTGIRLAK